jgi:hypothetical protein
MPIVLVPLPVCSALTSNCRCSNNTVLINLFCVVIPNVLTQNLRLQSERLPQVPAAITTVTTSAMDDAMTEEEVEV